MKHKKDKQRILQQIRMRDVALYIMRINYRKRRKKRKLKRLGKLCIVVRELKSPRWLYRMNFSNYNSSTKNNNINDR